MHLPLSVLREQSEADRFRRQAKDDSRTAIGDDNAASLAKALKARIDGEVRFDKGSRALYSTDGSNYRQAPIGVVLPRHVQDVLTTLELCRQFGAPILSRGGGTSLAGQCCNVAVLMDFSKYMHDVVNIDAPNKLGRVLPGCVLDTFRETAKSKANLFFGPDPATHSHCTIGGMLGNNSCGSHSLLSKNNGLGLRMSDNTHSLDIVTYDGCRMTVGPTSPDELQQIIKAGGRRGEIYSAIQALVERYGDVIRQRFPRFERRVSGYNLDELLPENGMNIARALVGSESTLVTILEATLHLVPSPNARAVAMLGFDDINTAAECAEHVLKFNPVACEGIDHLLFQYVKSKGDQNADIALLPKGRGFLLTEFAGDSKEDCDQQIARMSAAVNQLGRLAPMEIKTYDNKLHEQMIWDVREGALGATAWVPGLPDAWPGFEDSAVPVKQMPAYLKALRSLFDKYDYHPSVYGHLGQGCVHCRVPFDFYTAQGIEKYKRFMNEAVDLVLSFGGTASGEHGDGQARGQFLQRTFGNELYAAMVEFKRIWDPQNKMNPGKVISPDGEPYSITDNLRLGADYNPPQPETHFQFPDDRHSFARAALRCVGVGKCRREGGGTMCPSYQATREEKHSTRGRARMLFEMMNGEVLDDGWKSDEVYDALDLCLSCKGCKGDCPVNVDMATYKSEFLSHYYEGRLRPRHMFAFGFIHVWSRLASLAPTLVNVATQTPGLSRIAKWMADVAPQRKIPQFAPQTLQHWFRSRPPKNVDAQPVVLFPDTFNNHFHIDTARAAVETLEDAGFRVIVPQQDLCCGRPLYDYGFLPTAKRWWRQNLQALRPFIQGGIPMVVLEPSCWAAFRDELVNLLPNDEDAKRLRDLTLTLGEFLDQRAPHYQPPTLSRKVLLHGHCHQKSLEEVGDREFGKLHGEKNVLKKMGVDLEAPATGCCGMAGAFGFENGEHYETAMKVGEHVLLPAVRQADDDTLIVADGFSCREQIEQGTPRQAMHLAQVIQYAKHGASESGRPEAAMIARKRSEHRRATLRLGLTTALAVVAAAAVLHAVRSPSDRT
ncbi:MAG: FAD-binding and (Fe-S)-binding domain-containing protein [Tepidisphaeraceae bacterium]